MPGGGRASDLGRVMDGWRQMEHPPFRNWTRCPFRCFFKSRFFGVFWHILKQKVQCLGFSLWALSDDKKNAQCP